MTHQTKLNVGDIVSIKKAKLPYLVVRSEHVQDDPGDGIPYSVDEIDVVKIDALAWMFMFSAGPEKQLTFNDSQLKSFYFGGGSMSGKGKKIKGSDVLVLGTSKVEKQVSVTYHVTKPRSYG